MHIQPARWMHQQLACCMRNVLQTANRADTIYLPALAAVGRDLHANADLVAASVSIYMFTVGLGSVWWGPLAGAPPRPRRASAARAPCVTCVCLGAASLLPPVHSPPSAAVTAACCAWPADKIGRRVTYCITGAAFLGTTLGCVFSPTIQASGREFALAHDCQSRNAPGQRVRAACALLGNALAGAHWCPLTRSTAIRRRLQVLVALRALQGLAGDACSLATRRRHAAALLAGVPVVSASMRGVPTNAGPPLLLQTLAACMFVCRHGLQWPAS